MSEKRPSQTPEERASTRLSRLWCRLAHGGRSLVWGHEANYTPSGVMVDVVHSHFCGICGRSRLGKGSSDD
jgi:hypothetical protein